LTVRLVSALESIVEEVRQWPTLDAVVSSYLGETASNLRRILEYADQAPFYADGGLAGRMRGHH
jgi:hypothetical protein